MNIEAIILNVRDYRENDRIITCYTCELGKIEILVRSARKITSKLAHLTSGLYALINLVVEPGKNFYHLIGGEIKKYFNSISNNYEKNVRIGRILNIVDKIIKPAKPDRKVFDLIVKTLEKINVAPETKTEILVYAFLIKFLSFLGYRPEIKKCLICNKLIKISQNYTCHFFHDHEKNDSLYFDFAKGGVVCGRCIKERGEQVKVALLVLDILQNLLYQNFESLAQQSFTPDNFRQAKNIIDKFLEWHLNLN